MSAALEDLWADESVELSFTCDGDGLILVADVRAQRQGFRAGTTLEALAVPGTGEKLRAFLARARERAVRNIELPLISNGVASTFFVAARPRAGSIDVLACRLPPEYAASLERVQESMDEIVTLNRQMVQQKRQIEDQRDALQRTVQELDESNRGIRSLHLELEEKAEFLQRAAEIKSRVVANISHEFRTPLHTILGLSRLLLDLDGGPLTPEQQRQVQYLRTSAEELSLMVDDMLDLSSAESGRVVLRPQRFSAAEFFAALRGTLRPMISVPERIELKFDEPAQDLVLETDQSKLSQILRNLIVNGLKFTESGHVLVSARRENGEAIFEVEDTGIGIDAGNLETIFEEFSQVDSPLQRRNRGAGLGLPLSRKLAELLGGSLTVKSTPGRGSTFTLRVPAMHPDVSDLSELESRPLDPSRAPILVVEDDRKTIFIYERYLAMTGFQVVPARTVEEAERKLETLRPTAIVLDIMLEGESTWNFLNRLKQDPKTRDVPVLVVTVTNKEQKARALGADEFWLKPLDPDRLLSKLRGLKGAATNGHGSIVVIDDDERSQYLTERCLSGTPYKVMQANNGRDGVALAHEHSPQLILLDFLLKGETAFDVLDELKADPVTRNIPVVIVTSHTLDPKDRARLAQQTEVVLSKESLSREIAINRIRDVLRKAGARPSP